MSIQIRQETPQDYAPIEAMVIRSFREHTRSNGLSEAALIREIRAKPYYISELSFVAEQGGEMVGHFMFSHAPLSPDGQPGNLASGTIRAPTVMLAPVAVHSSHVRQGIGRAMLLLGIEQVRRQGYRGIQVEGNPAFYTKVGFVPSSTFGIHPPVDNQWLATHPQCLMFQELYPGSLQGIAGYVDYSMYENA